MSYGDFLSKIVFAGLKLNDTSVGYPVGKDLQLARSYELEEEGRSDYVNKYGIQEAHVSDVFTDGNIFSSVGDVSGWVLGVISGKVLSQASLKKLFSPSPASVIAEFPYGYGWIISKDKAGRKVFFHSGQWLNFESDIFVFPESQEVVVWLENQVTPAEFRTAFLRQILMDLHPEESI